MQLTQSVALQNIAPVHIRSKPAPAAPGCDSAREGDHAPPRRRERQAFLDSFKCRRHSVAVSETTQDHGQDSSAALRSSSLRVTKQRSAVLDAVWDHPHADTETVINSVRERLPSVSHQAVYDSLHTLTEVGLVRCIQPSGSVARYERRIGDNHHHLVCRSCNLIVDVDCTIGQAPCLTPSHDSGFIVEQAEITFWGLCPECAGSESGPTDSDLSPAV